MSWKDELGNYMNDQGKVRVEYLNQHVLEPAVKEFVERMAETEGLQKAEWNKNKEAKPGEGIQDSSLTKFHLRIPHPKIKSTRYMSTNFSSSVYILNGELVFNVRYHFIAGPFLGYKESIDIDALLKKHLGYSDIEFEEFKRDDIFMGDEKQGEEVGMVYSLKAREMINKHGSTYSESYPINEMAESDSICKRLLSLYKESNRLYADFKKNDTKGYLTQ